MNTEHVIGGGRADLPLTPRRPLPVRSLFLQAVNNPPSLFLNLAPLNHVRPSEATFSQYSYDFMLSILVEFGRAKRNV